MAERYEIEYSITYDFDIEAEDPSRIFYSLGGIIETSKEIDILLGRSINAEIEVQQYLSGIETGSILAKIREWLIMPDDQLRLGEQLNQPQIQQYINQSRDRVLEELSTPQELNKIESIDSMITDIENIAETSGISNVHFEPPPKLEIADQMQKISRKIQPVSDFDKVIYTSTGENPIILNPQFTVDLKSLESQAADEILENESNIILRIKRPDYLGDSRWEFKHGPRALSAKMTDSEWMERFRKREFSIKPGDSLKVRLMTRSAYDKKRELLSENHEVTKVFEIIPTEDPDQPNLIK